VTLAFKRVDARARDVFDAMGMKTRMWRNLGPYAKPFYFYCLPSARFVWHNSQGRFFTAAIYRKDSTSPEFLPSFAPLSSLHSCSYTFALAGRLCFRGLRTFCSFETRVGSPAKEVVEAVEAEILVEVVHREECADNSSVNQSSNSEHESTIASREDESTTVDADKASRNYFLGRLLSPSTVSGR
jgi:hypothetical protein